MAADALVLYLNDHFAGARSGLQLIEGLIESTEDAGTRQLLEDTRGEIAADRDVLEDIIRRVSGAPSVVREVGGWIAEKLAQLKLTIDDPSNGSLKRLEALEVLALGIDGKNALWRALSAVAPGIPELAGVNFSDLVRRAAEQFARIDELRMRAARVALMRQRDVAASPPQAARR